MGCRGMWQRPCLPFRWSFPRQVLCLWDQEGAVFPCRPGVSPRQGLCLSGRAFYKVRLCLPYQEEGSQGQDSPLSLALPPNKTISCQPGRGLGAGTSQIEGCLRAGLKLPHQAMAPLPGAPCSSNQVPSDLLPFPLLATSLGFQSPWLAGDSPTNGEGRGINLGLPLAGPRTVFLLPGRWMLVPGKADGFSSSECCSPLD